MSAFRTPANAVADCIQNCTACEHVALETLAWLEAKGDKYAEPQHLALLALCADTCAASARAMAGGFDAHVFLCHACAHVCQHCVELCLALGHERQLRACAAACANCARSCADIARSPEAVGAFERRAS